MHARTRTFGSWGHFFGDLEERIDRGRKRRSFDNAGVSEVLLREGGGSREASTRGSLRDGGEEGRQGCGVHGGGGWLP